MPLTFSASQLGTPKRASTYAVLKSLVNVDTAVPSDAGNLPGQSESAGQIVINFPCMPDMIELARRSNYSNVLRTPVTPDGLHLYDYTEPLSIPISFSLHSFDRDYCQDAGPLMLLSIAAKLHALMMPLHPGGRLGSKAVASAVQSRLQGESQAEPYYGKEVQTAGGASSVRSAFAYPPACSLNIMMAQLGGSGGTVNQSNDSVHSMGINCHGFVTDVRVVFKAPWLQGTFGSGDIRNMPSSAEFSFTFVHQPGHTNLLGNLGVGSSVITTSARDIYQRLYNTAGLGSNTDRALSEMVRYADLETTFSP